MPEVTFREAPTQPAETREYEKEPENNNTGVDTVTAEPVDSESMPQVVLDVLGLEGNVKDLPSEELSNLREISGYLESQLIIKGKVPNVNTMGRMLDNIREELGMDDQTDSSILLDRLGGVVKAWKNVGFISDSAQKRSLFMKLARCKNSKEMHRLVFQEMDRHSW